MRRSGVLLLDREAITMLLFLLRAVTKSERRREKQRQEEHTKSAV